MDLFPRGVTANKFLKAGGVTANKFLIAGGVPANKFLIAGGVPANKFLNAGGVLANNFLIAGGVPANNLFLKEIYQCSSEPKSSKGQGWRPLWSGSYESLGQYLCSSSS